VREDFTPLGRSKLRHYRRGAGEQVPAWLRGASVAPSAHNTQPWRFTPLPDGRIGVGWAPERTLPVGDPTSRDLYLSLGAAVESARLRALTEGVTLHFEPAPPDAKNVVGWLVPDLGAGSPDPADLALAAALDRRQTARGPCLPRAVPVSMLEALIAEAARSDRHLCIATDRPRVHRLAALAGRATAALFADHAVHAELWRWLRLDPTDSAYQRDGLTADCLELTGLPRWLARQTMPPARMRWLSRLGLHHLLASDTARVARKSAAICLLTTPIWDRDALVATGRVLQRLWLLTATAGLTTHPLSALLDCAETAGPTAAVFGVGRGPHAGPPP
jgi:hypothetical protein